MYFKAGKGYVDLEKDDLITVRRMLLQGHIMDVESYLSQSEEDWKDKDEQRKNRQFAWAFVYFYMSSDQGKEKLHEIIVAMKDKGLSSLDAVKESVNSDMVLLQNVFVKFIKKPPSRHRVY